MTGLAEFEKEMLALDKLDAQFRADLGLYAASLVQVADEHGRVDFLNFNLVQTLVDERLRLQMEAIGKVRAIILKARKLGISTYVAARFYRKTTLYTGQNTFILTHEDQATQTLFGIVKTIHDKMNKSFKPVATTNNANELAFNGIDSGYRVGTAKNVSGLGRSQTLQNFHGSEVGFWPHAETHLGGVMEAIPTLPRTEIILESTANGMGGMFYDIWNKAIAGQNEYMPIFLGWFLKDTNIRRGKVDFTISDEEREYQEIHRLSDEQLAWAHYKNIELGGDPGKFCWRFKQEHPATPQEAFQTSGVESFIRAEAVVRARHYKAPDQDMAAKVMGVDIARGGADRTRLLDRQGRKLGSLVNKTLHSDDLMHITGVVARTIDDFNIQMTFIDMTGIGSGVVDRLRELGYGKKITGVFFNQTPIDEGSYRNKRAEMWGELKNWIEDPAGVQIPDDDVIHAHICAPTSTYDSNSRLLLEPKEDIKKRLGFSPDSGDAAALTFADRVVRPEVSGSMFGRQKQQQPHHWTAN